MEKTGDIYVKGEKGRRVAYWRPVDGSRDVFLCAMDMGTYNKHPHLRKMFVELATEAMLNREREAGARPCTHKPCGVMRRTQCPLCPYSGRVRAAAQYVAMGHQLTLTRHFGLTKLT